LKIKCIFGQKKGYVENYPYFGRNSIFLEKPHKKEIIHQWLAPNFECKSTEAILYLYDFLTESRVVIDGVELQLGQPINYNARFGREVIELQNWIGLKICW